MSDFISNKKLKRASATAFCLLISVLFVIVSSFGVFAAENTMVSGDFEYVTGEGGVYITEYKGSQTKVTVPDKIEDKAVVGIDSEAFWYRSDIVSVELPDTIVAIGSRAFQGCKALESVSLPEGLMNIEDACFAQCESLEKIELPDSLYYVGSGVFDDTPFIEKFEGDSIILSDRIFYYYRGASDYVKIPDRITCISASAFLECDSLYRVDIPQSVEIIGSYAFYGCDNLKSIKLPQNLVELGPYAFGCYTEEENPEPQVMSDFVIYSNLTDSQGNGSLGAAYASEYGITLKGESEEPIYIPLSERSNSKISGKTVLLIVFISILVVVVGGGMLWGFLSDKRAKEKARNNRTNNRNNKKNKR